MTAALGHDVVLRRTSGDQRVAAEEIPDPDATDALRAERVAARVRSGDDDEQSFGRLALTHDPSALQDLDQTELSGDGDLLGGREGGEERIRAQLPIEHAAAGGGEDAPGQLGDPAHHRKERAAIEREQLRLDERRDGRIAGLARHEADLADQLAALEHRELAPRAAFRDRHDGPFDDDVETLRVVALMEEDLALRQLDDLGLDDEAMQRLGIEVREEREAGELVSQRRIDHAYTPIWQPRSRSDARRRGP